MTIIITSRTEGFRRCGVAHSIAPAEHLDERFTADELERLLEEPMLTVVVVPNDAGGDAGKSDDADKADDAGKSEDDDKADDAGKSEDAGKSDDADKADSAGKSEDGDKAESDAKTEKPARKPAK